MAYLPKGARVRISGLRALPLGTYSLAGVTDKVAAVSVNYTGTVRHLRGDDPLHPTVIKLYIEPDEGQELPRWTPTRAYGCTCETHGDTFEIDPSWVTEIL